MLSGKNERRFLRWFFTPEADTKISYSEFIKLPPEMQKGVYEKYFDSLGVDIDVYSIYNKGFIIHVENDITVLFDDQHTFYHTRLEAFTEAVKQLDKLINKKL